MKAAVCIATPQQPLAATTMEFAHTVSKVITITTLRGDVNHDGNITPTDAVIALEIAAGSREYDPAADINDDGMVTSLDALMILQAAVGQIGIC